MNTHLERALYNRFPTLYKHTYCECGDGWFMILWRLSEKLQPYSVESAQIKQKFGALRFYVRDMPEDISDKIYAFIDEAERESVKTCEVCGNPGKIRPTRWIMTLCDEHYESCGLKQS